jgi:hypothetical protein
MSSSQRFVLILWFVLIFTCLICLSAAGMENQPNKSLPLNYQLRINALASANDQSSFLLKLYNDTYQSLCKDESSNGLPNDWYSNSNSIIGAYCSPEEAGYYMLSHIGAAESNFISKIEAKERIEKTLRTLKGLPTLPKHLGLYYRYYDTADGRVTDKEVPSIGNAMLEASLMTIRKWADENNFKELSKNCSIIVNKINLSIFFNKSSNLFYHNLDMTGEWNYYSDEGRLLSFVAYARGNINESEFKKNLESLNQYNLYYNISTRATNKIGTRKDVFVSKTSWDGSMFTYLAPALFINETRTNYQGVTINPAVYAQIVYANHSGYKAKGTTVWGISDAYNEKGRYCDVYCGAPPTAAYLQDNSYEDCPGLIAPYASVLALLSSYSTNATENLIVLSQIPNLYHDTYGFKDTFNVKTGSVADRFVALHQEWIFLALMDKLNGIIWRYFYQNPEVIKAHKVMYPMT